MESGIRKGLNRQDLGMLNDDRLHIILIGSGGPLNNQERVGTSTAIIAGNEFILVDTGPCTWRNADLFDLPLAYLSGIFLTHFHSDHIGDLGEANFGSWAAGRKNRLEVYGPEGVDRVVAGFTMAYEQDMDYRIAHHGEDVMPRDASRPVSKTIKINEPDKAELFFDRNGLKVYAFMVDHFPAKPAVGYRFEYKGNVVVITGDTKMTNYLAGHAKNADILISDALADKLIGIAQRIAEENNRTRIAMILKDIPDYHMSPIKAAELARDSGSKKLVFFHITPPINNFILKRMFLDGVKDVYDGDIVLGEDGMRFDLEPK